MKTLREASKSTRWAFFHFLWTSVCTNVTVSSLKKSCRIRFALLFFHFTFGSLKVPLLPSLLFPCFCFCRKEKAPFLSSFQQFEKPHYGKLWNIVFLKDITLWFFPINVKSSHLFQDAFGPVTIFKSSLLWVNKLRNH
jgi:hypothetical protein